MNFQLMEATIHELISDTIDHFSIYIHTKDGDISINAHEPKRAAGTIKIPILIEAYRHLESNIVQPDALVYIENDMKAGGRGVINYLTNSNVYSYKNLLELMIIVSDNTAANIILDKIGMYTVNELATTIGCDHTKIGRRFMGHQDPTLDNYTSARDMVRFLHLIENHNEIVTDTSRKDIKKILLHQQINHKIASYAEQKTNVNIYHKTGELPGIEHDVALVTYREKKVYMAILSENWTNNGTGKDYLADIGKIVLEYTKS
ncbi:class A beta-lactamase-related serine hydrolase [Virgibacillus necropolis]|uniref:serine hydrolase n=1 Tax=Virgibacillus necropolis TaxID=163877 RepID=UPI00384FCFB8